MISRKEANKKAIMCSNKSMCCEGLVKEIYDSRGSCGECKHIGKKGVCKLHSEDSEADVVMMNNDFCSYFERVEDEII